MRTEARGATQSGHSPSRSPDVLDLVSGHRIPRLVRNKIGNHKRWRKHGAPSAVQVLFSIVKDGAHDVAWLLHPATPGLVHTDTACLFDRVVDRTPVCNASQCMTGDARD